MNRSSSAPDGDEDGDASARGGAVHGAREDSRTICICVDDFGLHGGVNGAALALAGMGRVHAITCMVGGSAWAAGCRDLREFDAGAVDAGLHLDLTESPLLPSSRRGLEALIGAAFLRRLDRAPLRAEIRAQLDAFEHGMGRLPAFIDGHQHIHQLPLVRDELLDELCSRYGAARPWLRSTRRFRHAGPKPAWRERVKPALIQVLGARGLTALARQRGFPMNRRLAGVYDFSGGAARYGALLSAWLHGASSGDLLMCHPGQGRHSADPLDAARTAEFSVLSSPALGALLRDERLALAPMSRILAHFESPA